MHRLVSLVREERNFYDTELLDLRNDFVFKAFFGDKRNNHLLLNFLNAVLEDVIISVELADPTIEILHADDKVFVMDIRVVANKGKEINIGMQMSGHKAFRERMLLYWAKVYGSQSKSGESYAELKKATQIVIANFELLSKPQYHSRFQLIDQDNGTVFSSHLDMHVLELSKLEDIKPDVANELEKWLLFIKGNKEEKEALAVESSVLHEALMEIERLSQDPKTKKLAIAREIQLSDQLQREEDAVERGLDYGLERGLEQGMEFQKREMVLNMYVEKLSKESIAKFTKIPLEKVNEIIWSAGE